MMPSIKKRINLTIDEGLLGDLTKLQHLRNGMPLASLIVELTREALELQEDLYFSKVADDIVENDLRRLGHEEVWS